MSKESRINLPPILKAIFQNQLDTHMIEVFRGAIITFCIKVASAGFAFVFNVLIARMLGAEGAGLFFLALPLITIAATIGRFGLDNTLLRFVSTHAAKSEWSQVRGVFRNGMLLCFSIAFFVSLFLFIISPWLANFVFRKPQLIPPLRLLSIAVVPLSLFWNIGEALKGLKRIRDSQVVQGLSLPVLTLGGLLLIQEKSGIVGVAWVYLVSAYCVLFFGIFLWKKATKQIGNVVGSFSFKKIIDSCIPLLWVQIMSLLMQWSSILFLGIWADKAEVGIFGAASRTALLTSLVLVSVNSIIAPKFAALYEQGQLVTLALVARNSTKMMATLAAPILLIFIIVPRWVMGMFGNDFSEGAAFLTIISIGQFVNVATGSVGYLLMMTGNERIVRNNTFFVGFLSITLNLILIPNFGGIGASVATAVSLSVMNLLAAYFVYKKLGIWTIPFGLKQN